MVRTELTAAQKTKWQDIRAKVSKIPGATVFSLGFDGQGRLKIADGSGPSMFITEDGELETH